MTRRRSHRSTIILALLLVIAPIGGVVGSVGAQPSAPPGMVGLPAENLEDLRGSGVERNVTASDLEGGVYVSEHASTTEVDLVTREQAVAVARGASPAEAAQANACDTPAGSNSPAFRDACRDESELSLVISDDVHHEGRQVAVRVDVIEQALGRVPESVVIANNETGEQWTSAARVEDGWLIADVEHFSSNSVTWSGTFEIDSSPTNDGAQFDYDLSTDSVSDYEINITGVENTQWDNVSATGVSPSGSQSISVGGTDDPAGPSASDLPTIEASIPVRFNGDVRDDVEITGTAVATEGDLAYVGSDHFAVVNVSDPGNPTLEGSITSGEIGSIKAESITPIDGTDYVAVADWEDSQVTVIDVSTPSNPSVVGNYGDTTRLQNAIGIAANSTHVYTTSKQNDYLTIVDVSDPANPTLAGSVSSATDLANPNDVALDTSTATAWVTAANNNAVTAVDVSDPANPSVAGSVSSDTTLNSSRRITLSGSGEAIVSVYGNGDRVTTIDTSTPSSPSVLGSVQDSGIGLGEGIAYANGYTYVVGYAPNRYAIVDTTDMASPSVTASVDSGESDTRGVSVTNGDVVFVGGNYLKTAEPRQAASSLSVSDGQGHSASFGTVETGDTVTKELAVDLSATSLSWSGSGDPIDYSLSMQERTITEDVVIEVNDNQTSYTGTLAAGSTATLSSSTSWLNTSGTNTVNVTVDSDGSLTSDAPTPQVGLYYTHSSADQQSVSFTDQEWTARYNVSKTFSSERTAADLNISFNSNVVAIRSVEARINETGGWSDASASTTLSGNDMIVDVVSVYGGTIPADTTIEIRADASKVQTDNMTIDVLEATPAGQDLNSKIEIVSIGSGGHIDVTPHAEGNLTHYAGSESWTDPQDYAVVGEAGDQSLYLPNAAAGGTFRTRRIPLEVVPSEGTAEVEVVDGPGQEFIVRPGDHPAGDTVELTWYDTVSGEGYALKNASSGETVVQDTASSPVRFLTDDQEAQYVIERVQATAAVSVGGGGGDGGGGGTLPLLALFGGMGLGIVGIAVIGRRYLGIDSRQGTLALLVGGGVIGLVGAEAVTTRSIVSDLSYALATAVGTGVGGFASSGFGAVLLGVGGIVALYLVQSRLGVSLPWWIWAIAVGAAILYMIETLSGGALSSGLGTVSSLIWLLVAGGAILLAWQALKGPTFKISAVQRLRGGDGQQ